VPSRFSLRRNTDDAPTAEISAPEPLVPAEVGTQGHNGGPHAGPSHDRAFHDSADPTLTNSESTAFDLERSDGFEGDDADLYEGGAGDIYPDVYGGDLEGNGPEALGQPDLDDDESWLAPDTRRRIRIAVPTFLLLTLAVIAGAFWGGAVVQKHFGTTSTESATAGLAGRGGAEGFAGFGGAATGAEGATGAAGAEGFGGGGTGFTRVTPTAEGTISAISGDDLTVKPTSGADVKVVMSSSTIVTRSGKGSAGSLRVGDTVRVDGNKASDGAVTATSITATAAGVTTATGGFGGAGAATGASGGTGFSGVSGSGSSTPTVANGGFSGDGGGATAG
jgi:hypothetical protein